MKTENEKTDRTLGSQVHAHLLSLGLETPMRQTDELSLTQHEKKHQIESSVYQIMSDLDLDLTDDSLIDTPRRVAKMLVNELFWGLDYDNFPKVTTVENKMGYNEMVLERNVRVTSMCEHHLLPIIGVAQVAYIPRTVVPGLSKINRIVEFFSRRPQIQERLTAQIHATLCFILKSNDVAVRVEGEHFCVKMRGVEDACSDTVTTRISGVFEKAEARNEFLLSIR